MSGKNLFNIELDYLIAPKRVLKDQAEHISQLSDETILARVETARGSQGMDECFTHSFHIRVPKLSYSAQLFEVTHGIDMYPVQVRNDDWSIEKDCPDASSFESAVSEILNSSETKRRLEALRSQAFAEMDDPPPMEANYAQSAAVPEPTPQEVETPDESVRDAQPNSEVEPEQTEEDQANDELASDMSTETDEVAEDVFGGEDAYFEEWGDPIEFNEEIVSTCPNQLGAAIIYTLEGSPLFIAYSKDIQGSLKRQLGRKASPVVSKARKAGLRFVCGTVRSIDDAEQTVESRINTMPFRGLLSDSDSCDWM